MKNKKVLPIIIVIVVVLAAVAAYLIYANSGYSVYKNAFSKTFGGDSMDLNTSVNATLDGSSISSTGSFKVKGFKTDPDNAQFLNTMNIDGKEIVQFSDGQYIYTDDGNSKNKISMSGADPTPRQEKENTEFSFDAYISEFSSLLDAGKIKELQSLEAVDEKYVSKITTSDVSGGKKYVVELLPELITKLTDTFLEENISTQSLKPTVDMKKVIYSVVIKNGYVSEIAFNLELDVTAPGESTAKAAVVEFSIKPQNPGQEVDFSLPSTDGF